MSLSLQFLIRTTLGIGVATLIVAASMRVLLRARADGGTANGLSRKLLQSSATAASLVFTAHAAMLIATGSADRRAEVSSLTLAGAAAVAGYWPPSAPVGGQRTRSRRSRTARAGSGSAAIAFPNYTQITSRIPLSIWRALRVCSLVGGMGMVALLLIAPATGLVVMWRIVIPVLPALFMISPGLWRNLCPLAASNQMPRALKITRAVSPPAWLKEYGYVIACSLFITFVALRRLGLDKSGVWSALLLFGAMASGFTGGMLLKGKSGWCSTICPLLPVQRIYGQTPLVMTANAHCQPCVGCVKNCYDFNPRAAYLSDLNDPDPYWGGYRRLFVAAFPGLVLSFFLVPRHPALGGLGWMAIYMAASVAVFTVLVTFVKTSVHVITSLYGAIAFSIFYWFAGAFGPLEMTWLIHLASLTLAATWLLRTIRTEVPFLQRGTASPAAATAPTGVGTAPTAATPTEEPAVTFLPENKRVLAAPGASLLDLAEAQGLSIEAGCRMGICGADPVAVKDGMGCTSAITEDEQATLDRLGLPSNTRMACCVCVSGPVSVTLKPDRPDTGAAAPTVRFPYDPSVEKVVIIGNGIAGVTAADQLRRRHPDVTIDVIAGEPHHLYNRMGIARLIYGRSAMQGLYLNPDSWYEQRKITTWLNTHAVEINRGRQTVRVGTGDELPYDRLILATGSRSHTPPIRGFGLAGTAVLRSAEDAIALRAYAQREQAQLAVVAGGGLLGLEAAYALQKLGLRTVVLERSKRLLRRQLDASASAMLTAHLQELGIEILTSTEVQTAHGNGRLGHVELTDGRTLPAQILLLAAGIQPNTELARRAGLAVNRGVVVDQTMRTSDPDIYAAGDIAEHHGELPGLWAAATAQAEIAAENTAGGERTYTPIVPATVLKVVGIDLTSIGRFDATSPAEEEIAHVDSLKRRYRKLVIADGRVVGAILLGVENNISTAVRAAITQEQDITRHLPQLRAGNWSTLTQSPARENRSLVALG